MTRGRGWMKLIAPLTKGGRRRKRAIRISHSLSAVIDPPADGDNGRAGRQPLPRSPRHPPVARRRLRWLRFEGEKGAFPIGGARGSVSGGADGKGAIRRSRILALKRRNFLLPFEKSQMGFTPSQQGGSNKSESPIPAMDGRASKEIIDLLPALNNDCMSGERRHRALSYYHDSLLRPNPPLLCMKNYALPSLTEMKNQMRLKGEGGI